MADRRLVVAAFVMVPLLAACAGSGTTADDTPSESPAAATTDADSDTSDDGHGHGGERGAAADAKSPERAPEELSCGVNTWDDGTLAEKYCHDGVATLTIDGETQTIEGATCEDRGLYTILHFGTAYSDQSDAQGDYIGIVLEAVKQPGKQRISALEMTLDGSRVEIADATVTAELGTERLQAQIEGTMSKKQQFELDMDCMLT